MFWVKKTMDITRLIPTHNRLRTPNKLWDIYQFYKSGSAKPIVINACAKKNYIQDGHHRLVVLYWMDTTTLGANQYILTKYSEKEYNEICFEKQWVTPFKLAEHVRVPDFGTFKDVALEKKSEKFIRDNPRLYREYRQHHSLSSFAGQYVPTAYLTKKLTTDSEKALGLPEANLYGLVRLNGSNFTIGGCCKVDGLIHEVRISGFRDLETPMEDARDIIV